MNNSDLYIYLNVQIIFNALNEIKHKMVKLIGFEMKETFTQKRSSSSRYWKTVFGRGQYIQEL